MKLGWNWWTKSAILGVFIALVVVAFGLTVGWNFDDASPGVSSRAPTPAPWPQVVVPEKTKPEAAPVPKVESVSPPAARITKERVKEEMRGELNALQAWTATWDIQSWLAAAAFLASLVLLIARWRVMAAGFFAGSILLALLPPISLDVSGTYDGARDLHPILKMRTLTALWSLQQWLTAAAFATAAVALVARRYVLAVATLAVAALLLIAPSNLLSDLLGFKLDLSGPFRGFALDTEDLLKPALIAVAAVFFLGMVVYLFKWKLGPAMWLGAAVLFLLLLANGGLSGLFGHSAQQIAESAGCSGRLKTVALTETPVKVNEDVCQWHFGVTGGTIELAGPRGKRIVRPGEEKDVPNTFMTRTARAIDGTPILRHTSCYPGRSFDGYTCR